MSETTNGADVENPQGASGSGPALDGAKPPRKTKALTIVVGLALAGLVLLTYTQPWVTVHANTPRGGTVDVTAAGSDAAPALSALAFAGLALFGALTIAGPVFRFVLGVLEALLGVCVVIQSLLALTDPIQASSAALTKVTGVSGDTSIRALVVRHGITAWPFVALAFGVLMAALGGAVIVLSRSWPVGSRRYQAVRIIDPNAPTDPVVAWDTLTVGADPTAQGSDPDDHGEPISSVDDESDDARPDHTR